MNKIEEILNKRIILYTSPIKEEIVEAMNEFGRLAFNAARKYHLHNTCEFDHYEEFLKEVEDERN